MKNNLDYFKKFVSKNDNENQSNFIVWSYTRVSSKEQFEKNGSVNRQKESNKEFADLNNYIIAEEFGGTYESAKDDFTRKEFKRLIEKIESSRKKPYALLVFKMSRFSRSGGGAIGLVNYLVEDLGVHLIEVCSGLSTTTERGKAAIYDSLFQAYKENLERKEIIVPAMQSFLRKGYFMGKSPIGYDHYGPKVRNDKFLSLQQRIVVNKDGELLREAWKWKASGLYSDAQILAKLAARGLNMTPQKLSATWRIPFYAGIIINRLIDEPAKGNWEPIVSVEDFVKVQTILESGTLPGNHAGYTHKKDVDSRPLTRLLRCEHCKHYLVGYRNKVKQLDYYRCLHCKGVSLNGMTTKRARRKGANELFIDYLNRFRLPDGFEPLVEWQLVQIFNHFNKGQSKQDIVLKSQLKEFEQKRERLEIRLGLEEINKSVYEKTLKHITEQEKNLTKEMNILTPQISNLNKLISSSLKKLQNLSIMWASHDLENKRWMHKTLFPDGVYYDATKHEYLTTQTNEFLDLTHCIATTWIENKNRNFQDFSENSGWVVPPRIELGSRV
jgi:site-specific DNA recombinase